MYSSDPFNPRIIGLSPLGNNLQPVGGQGFLVDGFLSEGFLDGQDQSEREVPLVFDPITGTWCAKLSKVNQEDRLVGLEVAQLTNEDQTFLSRAGFQQS